MDLVESEVISHNTMTFTLTPNKTILKTKHQTFILRPKEYCWTFQYKILVEDIRNNRVTNMNELVSRCNNKIDFIVSNYE